MTTSTLRRDGRGAGAYSTMRQRDHLFASPRGLEAMFRVGRNGEVGDEECHGDNARARQERVGSPVGPPRYWRGPRRRAAAPVCCMVWSIPDAAPASARGTPARIVTLSGKKHEPGPRCRRARAVRTGSRDSPRTAWPSRFPERRHAEREQSDRSIGRAPID